MSNYQLMKLTSVKEKGSSKLIDSDYFYQKKYSNMSGKFINVTCNTNKLSTGSSVSQTYFNSTRYVTENKKPKKQMTEDDFFNN